MDLLYLAYCFSLFFVPIILYLLLLKPKKTGVYTQPDCFHFAKKVIAKPYVNRFQNDWVEELQGVSDEDREKPEKNLKENEVDSQIIYGADTKGNYFSLKITLKYTLHAEISIEFRTNEGKIYRLPNEPQVLICSIASRQWKAAGLHIEILEPFQRLRITYNGLMRCCSKSDGSKVEGEVEHVKFHFLWNAGSGPLDYPQDVNVDLLTESIARESWRDGEWINMLGYDHGYDQFGALNGYFNSKSLKEDNFLYLPSWRRRRIGPGEAVDLKRDLFIFGVLKDGTIFSVGAKSIKMGCTQLRYGYVLTSSGYLHSISSNDIQLENLADNMEISNAFSVHFQANGRSYKCVCHVNTYRTSISYNRERNGWIVKNSTAECDVNSDQARAILTFWFKSAGDAQNLPKPLLAPKPAENPGEVFIANLSSPESLDHTLTGGKGNSLGMLSHCLKTDQFDVPPGFVITATSFSNQLDENPQLSEAISDLEDVCYKGKSEEVENACKRTMDAFSKTSISENIRHLIIEEISRLKSKSEDANWKWAVRSSGLDEDSDELSAAGQNTTILGCKSDEDVLRAVANCWGSLFSFQSVQYRRRHGIPINTKMAIVVQQMVAAESAGVLFTCHPSTGDPSQMIITSNYGLGESVVSGSSDPDTITLSRNCTDSLDILEIQIGEKKTKISLDNEQCGTKEIQVETSLSKKPSITEEQALKLGEVGVFLEKSFGNPRDIEWAFYNGKLYLLQSRPITTLNNWTDWELQHEFDTPIFSEKSVYTRANVGEVTKGAMTALSQCVVMGTMDTVMQKKGYEREPSPYCMGPIVISSHTVFLDMLNYMYSMVKSKLDLTIQVLDLGVFGHIVLTEELLMTALKRHGATKRIGLLIQQMKMFRKAWANSKVLQELLRYNNYWEIRLKPSYSPLIMVEKIEDQFDKLYQLLDYHMHTSTTSLLYQMIAMVTLTENSKEFKDEHYTDVALLLSTNSSVESAEIPVILEEITSTIRKANVADQFVKIDPNDGMRWLEEKCPKVRKSLDEFLAIHGHRVFKEFEFKEKTWAMEPGILISMLQANCASGATTTKKAKGFTVDETIAKLASPKKKMTKFILKFLVKKCREAVAAREKSKSELIRGIDRFRSAYIKLGQAMVSSGQLIEEDLVFHLTHEELKAVANGRSPGLVSKASRRKRLYEKWDKLHFPELNYGIPVPEEEKSDFDILSAGTNGIKLKGTPVYEGNIVARACVITDIKDAKTIQPGDILITYSTDIAWSPYFPMLSGVVTELGGLISHGAVVAREYGLPCVVGVKDVTKYFKTGDRIKLSGKMGLLELVD